MNFISCCSFVLCSLSLATVVITGGFIDYVLRINGVSKSEGSYSFMKIQGDVMNPHAKFRKGSSCIIWFRGVKLLGL